VGIGAAGNDTKAFFGKARGQYAGIGYDLPGVGGELGSHGFEETHCFRGHDVDQRSTLHPGEDCLVDRGAVLGARQDDSGAGSTQGLMRGGGDDIGVLAGVGMRAAGHQAGEVGHIH
jgi:hypothetical protein